MDILEDNFLKRTDKYFQRGDQIAKWEITSSTPCTVGIILYLFVGSSDLVIWKSDPNW